MGATIPAPIQPGSIDHVPFLITVVPCLGASLALREEEKSLSLPVPDHIPVASTEEEIAMHLAQQA
jgi:hypothetical protein